MTTVISWQAVFGIVPGYDFIGRIPSPEHGMDLATAAWYEAMEQEQNTSNILVTGIFSLSRVVYPSIRNFEHTITVTGNSNPKFHNPDKLGTFGDYWETLYKNAVTRVVHIVKTTLKQERVTLVFHEATDLVYMEPDYIPPDF